jgi:hypothetical protein
MVIGSFCRLPLKVAHDKVEACPVVIIASRKSRAGECEFLSQRVRRLLAHLGDGGRPSWRRVVVVVLPPLWHQRHRGNLCPGPRTAPPGSGGRARQMQSPAPFIAP